MWKLLQKSTQNLLCDVIWFPLEIGANNWDLSKAYDRIIPNGIALGNKRGETEIDCWKKYHWSFTLYRVFVCREYCFIISELSFYLQRASEQFAVARAQNQAAATREAKLKELAAAYDSFSELKSNLTEGTKVKKCLLQLTIMRTDPTSNVYSI